jgi:ribosomal-protein-alanine N-acetyltransferase
MDSSQIKTKKLLLRPFRATDYQAWLQSSTQSLPKKSKYDRDPLTKSQSTKKAYLKRLARYKRLAKSDHVYVYAVFERSTGSLIGVIDVFIVCRDILQQANIGYRIFNIYWRKGFGKEALAAGIRLSFKALKLNRIDALVNPDNRPSRALAKKIGMKHEGIRRKCFYQNDRWADQDIFSAHREEWGFPKLKIK